MEWKKLGEVCSDIIVPMRDRPKVFDGNIPWCRIEDIEGMYFNKSMSGLMVSDKVIKAMNLKVFPTGTVICSCSATLGVCAINTQPLITNQTFIGLVCSECLNNHFLYYYMLTRKKELKSLSTTGTIPYVSREKFEKMVIPVPSISEQSRIVGILDTFTASIENLKQQIAQRRKQYEHYRDQLLDLEGKEGVEIKTIGEVCKTITPPKKLATKNYQLQGLFPIIDQGQSVIVGYTDDESALVPNGEYVLFGDHTRFVKFYKGRFAQGADGLKILKVKDFVSSRYFYFAFSNAEVPSRGYSRHWSIAKELPIPVPSITEQQRIVSILDTFEASIANLEQQLVQRERQYEYYRNKLLTFE